MRYWSVDLRMSLVCRAFSESTGGDGCWAVSGAWMRRRSTGTWARAAILAWTWLLAMTLPSTTTRFLRLSTL